MIKKGIFFIIISLLFVAFFMFFGARAATIPTKINISNAPPTFLKNIPNQTWAGGNHANAFNLNDYFKDYDGDNLTFYSTPVNGINVSISSTGNVSFYPNPGFLGIRNVTFIASDGSFNTSSNLVILNTGVDTEPPKWFSPDKNPITIYQNTFVNFTTIWTDNFALANFTFSINQGSGWKNESGTFSGVKNTSFEKFQISAPSGTLVRWSFCAADTSNNQNCTKILNFTVSTQPTPPTSSSPPPPPSTPPPSNSSTVPSFLSNLTKPQQQISNFTVSPSFFHLALKQGTSQTRLLKVSDIGTSNLSFVLSVLALNSSVLLSTNQFSLGPGDSQSVTVDFSAGKYQSTGEYFGIITVKGSTSKEQKIPLVLDINPLLLDFNVSLVIPPKYQRVNSGKVVKANVTIDNLKDLPKANVTVYYAIKDLTGTVYNSSEFNVTLQSHVSVPISLKVPQGAASGVYLLYARGTVGNFSAITSTTFQVGPLFDLESIFKYGSIGSAVFVVFVLSLVLFLKYRRERAKEKLLSLYMMLTELKKLVEGGDKDQAIDLFVRIKSLYGEPVSKTSLENREQLRQEIDQLALKLKNDINSMSKGQASAVPGTPANGTAPATGTPAANTPQNPPVPGDNSAKNSAGKDTPPSNDVSSPAKDKGADVSSKPEPASATAPATTTATTTTPTAPETVPATGAPATPAGASSAKPASKKSSAKKKSTKKSSKKKSSPKKKK